MSEFPNPKPKQKPGAVKVLWWLLAVTLLAAFIWMLSAPLNTAPQNEFMAPIQTIEPPSEQPPVATVAYIVENPDQHVGGVFPAQEVYVLDVPTDRGFWIEDEGQRLFAIIIDAPEEDPLDINTGQRLLIESGKLRHARDLSQIPGEKIDMDTRRIIENQPIFLVVDERNIKILEAQ